jgi:hypothetical protein
MNFQKSLEQIIGLTLVALLLSACSVLQQPQQPTSAPTSIPPTSTPTPVPPTATPSLGRIEGKVVREPGTRIAGEVALVGPVNLTTTIDIQGYYSFADIEPGSYTLEVDLSISPCDMSGSIFTHPQYPVPAILVDTEEWTGVNFLIDLTYPIHLESYPFITSAGEIVTKDIDICH